jgi:xylulokinase
MSRAVNVLAVDLGTTGLKVAVVDAAGGVRASAGEVLPVIFTDDDGVEQDPHEWWDALGRCARRAIGASGIAGRDVTVVAVTSQYTSTVAIDERGSPLANAIMWMDRRGRTYNPAAGIAEALSRWLDVHGMAPSGNDDLGHIGFIRARWPEVYDSAHAFVEPMDALAARLTGRVTATQNTTLPMLSVDNRVWGSTEYSDELLAMSGLDVAKLPPLVPLGEPRGTVTREAADHLGVAVGAIVADATIDSVTSSIGTGVVDETRCGLVIGTTSVMVTHIPSKRVDAAHGLISAPSPLREMYFVVAENGIGGKALDFFVNHVVYADDGLGAPRPDDAYERVLAAASRAAPGSSGVLFLPWLVGSMAPRFDRRMRGGFVNLGLTSTRADMARAVVEGVAMNAAWLLPHFATFSGRSYGEIALGGGGAASSLWGQTLSECCGVAVRRVANPTATNAHGAGLLALVGTGHVALADVPSMVTTKELHTPAAANVAVYRAALDSFVEFHTCAAPFYDGLQNRERINVPDTRDAEEARP